MEPKDRLIVALDFDDIGDASRMVRTLSGAVSHFKIGLQMILHPMGMRFASSLVDQGKKVFLDAKLLDIDNTVMLAVDSAEKIGATFTTVHAYPKAMKAAVSMASEGDYSVKLLGVTVLTNLEHDDLKEAGYDAIYTSALLVKARAVQARQIGMHGLICSPGEVSEVRHVLGPSTPHVDGMGMVLVVPGIRPMGSIKHDQQRTGTPSQAIRDGADYLVVGRPIIHDPDPRKAAEAVILEIAMAAERVRA